MGSRTASAVLLGLAACTAPPATDSASGHLERAPASLSGVSVDGAALDARAFAAAAAFLFPEQSRALVRELLRAELAQREAQRLQLGPDAGAVQRSLDAALAGIQKGLPPGEDLEGWARRVYGRSLDEVRAALRSQLQDNQLYQLALRAGAHEQGRVRVAMLVSADAEQAETWARQLRLGADPAGMAAQSLERAPDGTPWFPPLPDYLPEPLGPALAGAQPGGVVGPLQLPGDSAWRVLLLRERLAPEAVPPVAALLAELAAQPVGALEARAWFEEMCRRYTAADPLPALQAPGPAFLPRASR